MFGVKEMEINNSTILITGGTGSFGNTFVRKVLKDFTPKKVIVFSRDEDKQHKMRMALNNPIVQFEIGDVRDRNRVFDALRGVDYVFHAAALKQVPSSEFFPLEAVKTNVIGTSNVLDAAIANKVKKVVVLSTDKAVYPINAMGMSKALMEKVALSKSLDSPDTKICVTRYGNVMCSRGSVIPIWIKAAKENREITVTENDMTRFLMSLDDAIELVFFAFLQGETGETFVMKAPASTMETLAKAIVTLFDSKSQLRVIGIRHGEKMHETLVGSEEMLRTVDLGDFYSIIPDVRGLNYTLYFSEGQNKKPLEIFSSDNTRRLDEAEVIGKLLTLQEVRDELEIRQ